MKKALMGQIVLIGVGNTATPLIGANPMRRTLIVSSESNVQITISTNPAVVLGSGININQSTLPLIMRWQDWGDWIRESLFAVCSVAGPTQVAIVDVIDCGCADNDDYLMGWQPAGVGSGTSRPNGGQGAGAGPGW